MKVIKRNGEEVEFNRAKIVCAITKANNAFAQINKKNTLCKEDINAIATRLYERCRKRQRATTVEEIQDMVETELMKAGAYEVAKLYIKYRNHHEKIRNANETLINYKKIVDDYLNVNDWRVKENSTVSYSVGGLILSNSGAITANYWLSEIYDDEIAEAHRNADLHIHDLSMLTGYCAGWSLKQLIQEGLGGVTGKITSTPASHLSTLCNQMVNFLGIMQNEWAGAQAFSSFDTYLAPFVKVDNLTYKEVKQCIQSFIYGVNTPSRWGTQAPFTNITLDWTVPNDLAELNAIVGGKETDFKYKDCEKEMAMVNKAFIEIMIEGDANGRGFQYPIPTYSITKDFDWSETENNRLLFEMTSKYGTPYFSNYINSDMEPSDVRSMAILGTQDVIYRDENKRVYKNEIRHLVKIWNKAPENKKPKYEMLMNGAFIPVIDMFEVPYPHEKYPTYVEITTKTGIKQSFSYDHRCPIVRNGEYIEVMSQDVSPGDCLLVAKHAYNDAEENAVGTYSAGKIVGYYLAEGRGGHNGTDIVFAINENRKDIVEDIEKFFNQQGIRTKTSHYENGHIYKVSVFSCSARKYMAHFISGDKATQKRLTTFVYDTSADFRRGIYDGYLSTDGSEKSKCFAHTTNKELCKDLQVLAATIGRTLKYTENENNTRYFKADKSDKESFTSYKLGIINLKSYNDDYYLLPVIDTKQKTSTANCVYNFTVGTKEHLYTLPNGVVTHQCCRLRLDLRELRKKSGGFFGSGESTGSVGVVTINMPRIAYLSKNQDEFYERLDKMMDIAARSLKIKRSVITNLLDVGLYPYTKRYLGTFDNHFSTIGLVGMNEACLNANWIQENLGNEKAQEFTRDVLNHMRERLSDYQERYGDLYNLEATPAESTAYRLAKHDVERYPDIITAAKDGGTPYYTNSSHLPVGYTSDIFEALDIQDKLQVLYTSGTVFHSFLGEKLPDWKAAARIVRKIAENYHLPYYTISPTYSVCQTHGYLQGEQKKCPFCGKVTEVYSRITGYYRPVQNWNDGKTQEFNDRKTYNIGDFPPEKASVNLAHSNQKDVIYIEPNKIKTCNDEHKVKLMLFTTPTCPNCKMAVMLLEKRGASFEKICATERIDLVNKYKIKQAPTLVVESNEVQKYAGISGIKKYLQTFMQ